LLICFEIEVKHICNVLALIDFVLCLHKMKFVQSRLMSEGERLTYLEHWKSFIFFYLFRLKEEVPQPRTIPPKEESVEDVATLSESSIIFCNLEELDFTNQPDWLVAEDYGTYTVEPCNDDCSKGPQKCNN
jgi:hypothetical protein